MNLEELRARKGFICDMDGVIYLGNQLLPGVREFVKMCIRDSFHTIYYKVVAVGSSFYWRYGHRPYTRDRFHQDVYKRQLWRFAVSTLPGILSR